MGIDVCADGVGRWVKVKVEEIGVDDNVDCIIISRKTADDLISGDRHAMKLEPLPRPHLVQTNGKILRCHHKISATWRWLREAYTHDAELFVSPELEGQYKMVMPRPKGPLTRTIPSLKPLYNVVLSEDEKRRQQQQNAQATVVQQNAMQTSHKIKLDKFSLQVKSNASTPRK